MSNQRVDLGFGSELEAFDPKEWETPPKPKATAAPAATKAAAEAAGFKSREPVKEPPKPPQRRRKTGRNQQLNIKAKAETIAAFYAIADENDWVLGEAFEHAVALLEQSQNAKP